MNRISRLASAAARLLACALVGAAACAAAPRAALDEVTPTSRPRPSAVAASPRWADGEVLVRFRAPKPGAERASALAAVGYSGLHEYRRAGVTPVRRVGVGVEEAVARLSAVPGVEYAEAS
jgi:hypothetical protein